MNLSRHRRKDIEERVVKIENLTELDFEYIGLFLYERSKDYLKRNSIVLQEEIKTKLIRASTENLRVKTQILLDRRLLEKIQFGLL